MRHKACYPLILLVLMICVWATTPADGALCSKEGDPGLYVDFGEEARDVFAGQTIMWTVAPTNFGFVSALCPDTDTFCVSVSSSSGWILSGDPAFGSCHILDPGYLFWQDIEILVPCDVSVCDYETLIVIQKYCNADGLCDSLCTEGADCENPNWYGGNPYYSADTVILHVVEAPPSLYILQDSLYFIDEGQSHAYVPFSVCNGDPCAPPTDFSYIITNKGHVPGNPAFPQGGSIIVTGGECDEVYATVDGTSATYLAIDTLTIIAWDTPTGSVYDTCVQLIQVLEYP